MASCLLSRGSVKKLSSLLLANSPSISSPLSSYRFIRSAAAFRSGPSSSVRYASYRPVNLVLSDGTPRFDSEVVEPPKGKKYLPKKRFKLLLKREKQKRKAANKNDPCHLTPKKKKNQKFLTFEDRIKYKIEKARLKESLLVEKLKKYDIPKAQGAEPEPSSLTGEERHYLKKMSQKQSNYVPIGRRGIFGGVILNMHLHWKKHETVKVICKSKPCKPGIIQEYASELARLSGGVPIQVIGNDTVVFYRGKDYEQPDVMSPIDTLSKKKALEKSKYVQSLEAVRHYISVSEKELELYHRHIALYGGPKSDDADLVHSTSKEATLEANSEETKFHSAMDDTSSDEIDPLRYTDSEGDDGHEVEYNDEADYSCDDTEDHRKIKEF